MSGAIALQRPPVQHSRMRRTEPIDRGIDEQESGAVAPSIPSSARRTWLAASAALVAFPRAVLAQSTPKVYRIGILRGVTPDSVRVWDGFFTDLRRFGYLQGTNLDLEIREYGNATRDPDALASELVRLPVDVIVTGASPAAEAAKRATSTIPIVMTAHPDPVGSGLVSSLARPGGNVTGLSVVTRELRGKQLQILKEVVPGVAKVAVLHNPDIPVQVRELKEVEVAGRSLGVRIIAVQARSVAEFADAFAAAARERAEAMIAFGGAVFFANRQQLVGYAGRGRLPVIYSFREFADAGGLMAYGPSLSESYRRAAWYVDRVLKGAHPQELAVEQPSQFEFVVNTTTAKTLGLVVPPAVLARAELVS